MEHRYLKTKIGKFHALIVAPTIPLLILGLWLEHINGKQPVWWGILISPFGFLLFLKAKISNIKKGKWFTLGCDHMDQMHTYFYFFGWVIMIAGYFLSFQ